MIRQNARNVPQLRFSEGAVLCTSLSPSPPKLVFLAS
jgi:hypothetical protein